MNTNDIVKIIKEQISPEGVPVSVIMHGCIIEATVAWHPNTRSLIIAPLSNMNSSMEILKP